jgi:hypothetical protein
MVVLKQRQLLRCQRGQLLLQLVVMLLQGLQLALLLLHGLDALLQRGLSLLRPMISGRQLQLLVCCTNMTPTATTIAGGSGSSYMRSRPQTPVDNVVHRY